jgi:hypothetical protein
VTYDQALAFFGECHRVLCGGGVVRIAVPSIERVMRYGIQDYFNFAAKWAPDNTRRGAMHAILYAHGHRAPWTTSLLETSLFYAGFNTIEILTPGQSDHEELREVEGHGKVIGDAFNFIETTVCEGTK